jgi:hypothetical protein
MDFFIQRHLERSEGPYHRCMFQDYHCEPRGRDKVLRCAQDDKNFFMTDNRKKRVSHHRRGWVS